MRISYINPKHLKPGDESKLYFCHTVSIRINGKESKIRMATSDEFDNWMLADSRRQVRPGFIPIVWIK